MRVDGAVTYDVSQGHDVKYVGITADGSKVFFTSKEQLTGEDHDASVDLYVWELATDEITLISKGNNPGAAGEPGQSDACSAGFTTGCGALTYSVQPYCVVPGARGGNCLSDSSIASRSGEIYFFSPEQLDGSRGISNKENLYLYRNGKVQYVTTFTTGPFCEGENFQKICANTPIARMQVTPDGSHMAFLTAGPVTQYDNAGHLEMYLYDPATRTIVCASCIPSGASPTSNVGASQDGLFIANDGRVSFSTSDPLVLGDTNEALDVYEYVNGSPQLITPGTGATQEPPGSPLAGTNSPGLIGVSATGADVYFSTYDTLVPADHNGLFLKFYDARAAGGFSSPAPPPPSDAADECHGVGNSPPGTISNGTGVALGAGGNAAVGPGRKKPRHPKKKHHARRRAHHRKGGSR
jgi:hypothetical protein